MFIKYYNNVNKKLDLLDFFNNNLFYVFNEFEEKVNQKHVNSVICDDDIKVELPGVKVSDIDITVDERTLKITGKSRHEKEFNYSFLLKTDVDDNAITAKFQDGLLNIFLPKKQNTSLKKIIISS